ncbi:MAG: peptide-methionine (S)-S-oxide reductase MsrA [Brevirhabdus sp.]
MTLTQAKPFALFLAIILGFFAQCNAVRAGQTQTAIVAGGCFWCVESDFEKVKGVKSVVSGYTGGKVANPTYKQVGRGKTGHVEAVKITFDSGVVSYDELLHLFLRSVDVTDAGGQFCDRGPTYATAIFVKGAAQKAAAQKAVAEAEAELGRKIVTPIRQAKTFYPAEDYHQDYYKGTNKVLTRFGYIKQSKAYKNYRKGCGRDARVKQVWGSAAFGG